MKTMVTSILFRAGEGGYSVHRIPTLLAMARGVVLASIEARRGLGGDWDRNDILWRRSTDGGRTFGEPKILAAASSYGPGPVSNLVLIDDPAAGCVHGLFCHNYASVFHMKSLDEGVSFSTPREITAAGEELRRAYPWKVIAVGPGHGLRLSDGRLIVPLWMSDGSGTEFGPGKLGHRPSVVAGLYSDDGGESWQAADIMARHGQTVPYRSGAATIVNPSETIPLELSDGRVLFNIRSESAPHKRLVSVSPDGASGWSEPRFDEELLEPVCMASIVRARPSGAVVFVNPDNLEHAFGDPTRVGCDRKRLTAKLSADDGKTWTHARLLEEGPSSYSDLAALPDDGLLCLYEAGGSGPAGDDRHVTLARFDVAWIQGGTGCKSSV